MAFRKTFTVNTEDINSFGFRTLTDGIDISAAQKNCPAFYNHNTWDGTIGHWENIRKDGVNLIADFVSEGITEQERNIISKIECGDVKGASPGLDPKDWSDEPQYLQKGQTGKTLIKSNLFEISITPLPSNESSLALKRNGTPVTLSSSNINNIIPKIKNNMAEIKLNAIALKLGLKEDATEGEILTAIGNVQLSKTSLEGVTKDILDKSSEGLDETQKGIFVTLSKTDAKQAIGYAESVKKQVNQEDGKTVRLSKDVKVSDLLKQRTSGNAGGADDGKETFDYLSKHNVVELKRIQQEESDKYIQLTRDYANGVRYKTN